MSLRGCGRPQQIVVDVGAEPEPVGEGEEGATGGSTARRRWLVELPSLAGDGDEAVSS